jgi:phage terminase large subunit GpA-like protein
VSEFADPEAVIARAMRAWKPPPRLSLSEWAEEFFVLSSETAAEPGRWKTLPYQRGIMDAITDPVVNEVSLMKSARIGYTLMLSATLGYHMHQDPTSILVVQPTVDDAKNFSKETIAPMLRDVPVLAQMVFRDLEDKGPKDASNTLTHKAFAGGVLSLVGANSGAGFRRISRRVVLLDEVDAYPPSAGSEGDPVRLAQMRSQSFWNRKRIAGSTPLVAGNSRIEKLYRDGDQRRYCVPCPHCGHVAPFVFRGTDGHVMRWDEGKPETAYFVCQGGGCVIEHHDKRTMIERGEWRAEAPFKGHASFQIWAAYSYSPNATWGHIASEFLAANRDGPEALRTFVNTVLGETWVEKGEAPEWRRLYERREAYERGTVPPEVVVLTAGVDVQRDRLVWEVVGWGEDRQSWSIDADVIMGKTDGDEPWKTLDELLNQQWPGAEGRQHQVAMLAVDSGDQTQRVYDWARGYPMSRVIAVKGAAAAKMLIDSPTAVDIDFRGKRRARGYKVWPVSSAMAKSQLYGWLGLDSPTQPGEEYPPGYCHFPEYGEEFFKQLTAEQLVKVVKRGGYVAHEWQVIPGRQNHFLDCRVYARAASVRAGLDRLAARKRAGAPVPRPAPAAPRVDDQVQQLEAPAQAPRPGAPARPVRAGWLGGGGRSGGGWLGRK